MLAAPHRQEPPRPLRVLVVDDHPALRAGLRGLLAGEDDLECLDALSDLRELHDVVRAEQPDLVLLDYVLGREDGLSACFRLKQLPHPPAVVLYSAYVDEVFAVPAAVAQADAIVSKADSADALLATLRRVASGIAEPLTLDRELLDAASARLRADDLPVAGMLLSGTPVLEIAEALGLTAVDVHARALRIIGRLQAGHRLADAGAQAPVAR